LAHMIFASKGLSLMQAVNLAGAAEDGEPGDV
jgi:hypothetical protein